MIPVLVHVRPLDLVTNARVDIRLCSALNTEAYGLNAQFWEPALRTRPRISQDLFSPDMDGKFQLATADLTIALMEMKQADWTRLYWEGADVTIYRVTDLNWPLRKVEFSGRVKNCPLDYDNRGVRLNCESDKTRVQKPLLTLEFSGGGGALGDAGKRGVLKPAGFGVCESIDIVWFDETYNIGMIDGYGNLTSVQKLMEGLSDMGASVANYANYAALKAAIIAKTVPPGRWGTCLAEGLIGLGAPPAGRMTVNATFGSTLPGAIISRWLTTHAAVAGGDIDTASLTALNVAVPYEMRCHFTSQQQVDDLIENVCRTCNASPLIKIDGKIAVTRAIAGAPSATLNKSNQTLPAYTDWAIGDPITPSYRIILRAARPGVVLSYDEVNYVDDLIDRGLYQDAETYRAGNIVYLEDGSSYLYINGTPTAGNDPPNVAYWQLLAPGPVVDWSTGVAGPGKPEDNATVGAPAGTDINGIPVGDITGPVTGGLNPDGSVKPGKVVTTSIVSNGVSRTITTQNGNTLVPVAQGVGSHVVIASLTSVVSTSFLLNGSVLIGIDPFGAGPIQASYDLYYRINGGAWVAMTGNNAAGPGTVRTIFSFRSPAGTALQSEFMLPVNFGCNVGAAGNNIDFSIYCRTTGGSNGSDWGHTAAHLTVTELRR